MDVNSVCVAQSYFPDASPRRILLFHPPLYDTRFPWHQWQQPVSLFQLATLFRRYHCDIRYIDALPLTNNNVKRKRIRIFNRGEHSVNYWRLGLPASELLNQLKLLREEKWEPDEVYIEGFATIWWEGVAEAVTLVRKLFSHAKVILYGAYPALATKHASTYSDADILVTESIEGIAGLPLDLTLYASRPPFTYISIGENTRPSSDVIEEFLAKATPKNIKESIRQFVFADHNVIERFPEQFRTLLKTVIDRKLKVSFYALGNIYPSDLVEDPELASLLFRANFKQLVFADDRHLPLSQSARSVLIEQYHQAIEYCINAGYPKYTEALVASACAGRLGENIEEVSTFITDLAHVAGSLIVIPYQPSPFECPDLPLELQNGKLFPFAERNGQSYRMYQDILGFAAILNAKYRSRTFDFLGDSLVSQLVRSSLVNKSWDPSNEQNQQKEKAVTAGWFNKEGKWVKS